MSWSVRAKNWAPWSEADLKALRKLVLLELPMRAIAPKLERAEEAARQKLHRAALADTKAGRSVSTASQLAGPCQVASRPLLSTRLIKGALAGLVATAPMTAAMRRLHGNLRPKDRYPLPPREIVGAVAPVLPTVQARNATLVAHFAYGAACGALLAALRSRPSQGAGMAGGLAVWLASYTGWIPAANILKPATEHPGPRNAIMMLAHVVWGSAFALTLAELMKDDDIFGGGSLKDVTVVRTGHSKLFDSSSIANSS